jgi:glycosyl hydrolase family 26
MPRLLVVTALSVLALVLLVPSGAGTPAVSSLYLGVTGDPGRFQAQTGQAPAIRQAFISWDQGRTFGKKIPVLLASLRPIPMVHIGTGGPRGTSEAIKPLQIAQGRGDAFLIALNEGIAVHEGLVYLRLMAEMNHHQWFHSAFHANGSSKGPQYSPAAYRKAFARMYLILHGGTRAAINTALRRLGLPPLVGGDTDLAENLPDKLRIIWNPLGGGAPVIPANAARRFYPGDRYVDVVGNDMYDSTGTFSAEKNEALYAFARAHGKLYSFPEWGLVRIDDPEFVRYICAFIRTHAGIELAAYYQSKNGSIYDLATKPNASNAYRKCITPLGRRAPG